MASGGPLGLRTFEAIGCEVVPLFIEPDGSFPEPPPRPAERSEPRGPDARGARAGAALGIGLDGDGDRLGVVDGSGAMVFADRYLIVLARHVLARGPAPIVFDVKCSTVLRDAIRAFGGTPVMWKTGYTNGSAKMREVGAPLAGELSGHVLLDIDAIIPSTTARSLAATCSRRWSRAARRWNRRWRPTRSLPVAAGRSAALR